MIRTSIAALGVACALVLVAQPGFARDVVVRQNGKTTVDAPTTRVAVDEASGATRVKVHAPGTRVAVDTERGQVRIRVPGFSGDISW